MLGMLEHLTLASIAFMLITGIIGYEITVTIHSIATTETVKEAKAKEYLLPMMIELYI